MIYITLTSVYIPGITITRKSIVRIISTKHSESKHGFRASRPPK